MRAPRSYRKVLEGRKLRIARTLSLELRSRNGQADHESFRPPVAGDLAGKRVGDRDARQDAAESLIACRRGDRRAAALGLPDDDCVALFDHDDFHRTGRR